jgi:hypothetical protein
MRFHRLTRGVIAFLALSSLWGGPARAEIIYVNDFQTGAGLEWSSSIIDTTPGTLAHPSDRFLGRFGSDVGFTPNVVLTLNSLPGHEAVTLTFDLYIIATWDGNDQTQFGPDRFTLGVEGGPTLLDTTFSNVTSPPFGIPFPQSYPDPFLSASHPQFTGALESRTLGYEFSGFNTDAVYRLSFTFPHTDSSVAFNFLANTNVTGFGGNAGVEWFGIDNITVNTTRAAVPEPSSFLLLALAGFGIAALRLRRASSEAAPERDRQA